MTIVRMPEVATGTGSAAIQTWLVAVGDSVSSGQAIVEIETEKAVVDYEVDIEGVFAGTLLAEGESADVGTPIAVIAVGGQSIEDAMQEAGAEGPAAPGQSHGTRDSQAQPAGSADEPETKVAAPGDPGRRQFMSPLVRRLAREQGIDLTGVVGSGPNGRIVRRDLEHLSAAAQDPTVADTSQTAQHSAPSAAHFWPAISTRGGCSWCSA